MYTKEQVEAVLGGLERIRGELIRDPSLDTDYETWTEFQDLVERRYHVRDVVLDSVAGQNAFLAEPVMEPLDWDGEWPVVDCWGDLTGEITDGQDGDWYAVDVDEQGITGEGCMAMCRTRPELCIELCRD